MDENEALAREHELYCLSGKPKLFQDGFNKGFHEGWQATKADSEREIAELQSNINKLREQLEKAIQCIENVGDRYGFSLNLAKLILAETSAQSLKAYDDELIERCAKECEYAATPYRDADKFYICAEAVRALKGE